MRPGIEAIQVQTMKTQGVQLLLLLLCVVSTCWGQQVYLTLGSGPSITTDNTEILITAIGEDGGLPSLTCHTDLTTCCRSSDNNGMGALGQWTFPDGSVVLQNAGSMTAGQQFYILKGAPQVIRLARREANNPLTPTGSYCCTVPTTGGDMTLCANLVAPTCSDNLSEISNGAITYASGSTNNRPVGATASYSCFNPYTLVGVSVRTCGSNGEWSSTPAPVCQMITCTDLPSLANENVDYGAGSPDSRPVDTVATYTCDTGYTLNGDSTRTCRSDRLWSGSAPTCQPNCPDLTPSLANGMIMYSGGSPDNRPLGSSAVHSCNFGYTLTGGITTRICVSGGIWAGSPPTCQISCGPPSSINNGSPGQPTSTMIGGEATYTCDTGYLLIGSETITCLSAGNWSSSPACQIPPPVYLSLSSTNYLSGLSEISLSSLGERSGLVCHTDLAGCCGNTGDWYYPNGSVVMEDGALYVSRGQMSVSLMMSRTATAHGGVYCCVVPTSGGIDTACIVLSAMQSTQSITASTDESSPCQCDNTGAVVGGAVALVAVVTIVTGVVMVAYLVLRYKRGGKMTVTQDISLTDQGQSAAATYETVPAVYDEIPASKNVKGDYVFSQNNAYSTVSGRL